MSLVHARSGVGGRQRHDNPHLGVASILACVLVIGATIGFSTRGVSAAPGVAAPHATSERAAVASLTWTSNVKVVVGTSSWTFRSTGVPASVFTAPHYAVPSNPLNVSAQGARIIPTAAVLRNQHYVFRIPLTPRYSSKTTTNLGAIGVLLDGAVLYNPYEANDSTVATAHNFKLTRNGTTASFIDSCDGHPGPGGQYHYHGMPACLVAYATTGKTKQVTAVTSFTGSRTAAVAKTTPAARHPVLLGFAFDGYGIYDNIAMNGSTIPVAHLDACNGITSPVPGYPDGIYHYVLENVKTKRSSLGCYHGVVSSAYTKALEGSIRALLPVSRVAGAGLVALPVLSGAGFVANPRDVATLIAEFERLSRQSYCG